MAQKYTLLIASADGIVWDFKPLRPPKLYTTIMLDNKQVAKSPDKRSLNPKWNFGVNLSCSSTSTITLQLYRNHILGADTLLGECKIGIQELLNQSGSGKVGLDIAAAKTSARLSVRLESQEAAARSGVDRIQSLTTGLETVTGAGAAQSHLATSIATVMGRFEPLIGMGDKLAEVHPYVTVAWNVLTSVFKAVKQQQDMDKEVLELVQTMVDVYSSTEDVSFVLQKAQILADTIGKIGETTTECANFVEQYAESGFIGRTFRTTFLDKNREKIEDLTQDLVKLRKSFNHALRIQILAHTTGIQAHTTGLQVHTAEILGTVKKFDQSGVLERLGHISYDASLHSECLEGTRTAILDEITQWVTTPSDTGNILWLSGVAGSGKSSIATSLSQRFRQQQCLGAFIFFTRDNLRNSNPTTVLHTIAYKLAQVNNSIQDSLCAAIAQNPDILDAPIRSQFETVLRGPLLSVQHVMEKPLVVILDALDECSDADWRAALISLITAHFSTLPGVFRFVITSRPEADIKRHFRLHKNIVLAVSAAEPGTDVVLYIETQLKAIAQSFELPREWPGTYAVNQLAEHSGGLFIWAATACKFIQGFDPEEKLQHLLTQEFHAGNHLDHMYTVALQGSGPWTNDKHFVKMAQAILGCIVLARALLADKTMDSLLSLKPGTASKVLGQLGCVIHCSHDGTARVLHASFSDYLLDFERSGNNPWSIKSGIHHQSLGQGCFNILSTQLRFNICDLEDSHLLNSEVPDLPTRLNILTPELCYASEYWVDHLHEAEAKHALLAKLQNFLQVYFLYWLEVMSLLGKVQEAKHILGKARWDVRQEVESRGIELLLHDAQRFTDGFSPVIVQSVPHIYISALALAPRESLVQDNFRKTFPRVLRHNSFANRDWASLQKTLTGHTNAVLSVVFSSNGRQIASGSADRTIRILDSQTGAALGEPLTGHGHPVRSVVFSPDGKQIASGSNENTICIWNSETGAPLGEPLTGHSRWVLSVVFSPDGKQIVSGSGDHTIRIWDSQTGAPLGEPLTGHSGPILSVVFSPDGTRIASGSGDHTMRIWDAKTAAPFGEPLPGHSDWVRSVVFSPNGKQIASGSSDQTIRIWDAQTGAPLGEPLTGHSSSVQSVVFSPNSKGIASGSLDGTIRIWDAETGAPLGEPLTGHIHSVHSVVFSPDGNNIASGSEDKTIHIWDVETSAPLGEPLTGHSKAVRSVQFSPNGKHIASGSWDKTIRIWDAQTGAPLCASEPLPGPSGFIESVVFSPNGKQIASGSFDKTICLWDSQTSAPIGEPLTGHGGWVLSVVFSSDGKRIASCSDDETIRIWDAETGAPFCEPLTGHGRSVLSVGFSPNGKQIASGSSDHTIRIWDAQTGAPLGEPLTGHGGSVQSVIFSPNGKQIASGSWDKTIRIWDAETGAPLGEPLTGHSDRVWSVVFSPDSKQIASGSWDKTIRIWDSQTGAPLGKPLTGHSRWVLSLVFSPDGKQIASGSSDRTIRIWNLDPNMSLGNCASSSLPDVTPDSLVHEVSMVQTIPSTISDDGWILNSLSHRLIWVPAWLRTGFCGPSNHLVITPQGVTTLDLTDFVHGTDWHRCKCELCM